MQRIVDSQAMQLLITLVTYAFYALILGLSFTPAAALVIWAWQAIVQPMGSISFSPVLLFGLCLGAAVYVFLISAVLVMSVSIRLMSLGIRPGRYPRAHPTTLRWLIYGGICTLAYRLVLPLIPVTWFSNLFFRIVGCRFGKQVYLNSYILNDAYLIEIGDNVIVGGGAEISCHLYEEDHLILDRIKIGSGTLIGANAYISPGVVIGKNCTIGQGAYIRRGKRIPDGACYTGIAGIPIRQAAIIEKVASRRHARS
jgi:acetyltransferase-like isoleucine patch superfamily enzyme